VLEQCAKNRAVAKVTSLSEPMAIASSFIILAKSSSEANRRVFGVWAAGATHARQLTRSEILCISCGCCACCGPENGVMCATCGCYTADATREDARCVKNQSHCYAHLIIQMCNSSEICVRDPSSACARHLVLRCSPSAGHVINHDHLAFFSCQNSADCDLLLD